MEIIPFVDAWEEGSMSSNRNQRSASWQRLGWLSALVFVQLGVAATAFALTHGQSGASGALGIDASTEENGGEEVAVDEASGSLRLSIPIELPPGPNDLVPNLALSYTSAGGNGAVGVGWSLDVPSVKCASRFGVPRDGFGACTRFEYAGQLLAGPDAAHQPPRWHTLEESFQRIERTQGGSGTGWSVWTGDGLRFAFGGDAAHRVEGPGGTAEWLLAWVEDAYGNRMHFDYAPPSAAQSGVPRLERVDYAGGTREVFFVYESRPDPIRDFRGGVARSSSERLREIRVEVNGALHHRVVLRYEQALMTRLSRLVSIQRFGNDCDPASVPDPTPEAGCTALPASTFSYSDTGRASASVKWDFQGAPEVIPTATGRPSPEIPVPPWYAPGDNPFSTGSPWLRGVTAQMADVNGDGLPDIVGDWPGRAHRENELVPAWTQPRGWNRGDWSSPIVMINNGVDGWDYPDGHNASQIWTDRIRALAFDLPSIRVKQLASVDPIDDWPHLDGGLWEGVALTKAFGTCVDPGEDLPQVEWLPIGDIQFAGVEEWGTPPYYDASVYRNFTPEACDDPFLDYPGCVAIAPSEVIPTETEIRAWPHFQFVDLDADGRSDLVMSARLSGFHLSMDDCVSRQIPARGEETWIEGASTRVVFMNNGEGWDRDDGRDPGDGVIADSLPLFGITAFESSDLTWLRLGAWDGEGELVPNPENPVGDSYRSDAFTSPCDDYGLAGLRGQHFAWVMNTSWDFCIATYDLTPVFTDLNGDGYPDLVVTDTADPDALFHNFLGGEPTGWRDSAGIESVAYLQNPDPGPGEVRWERAQEYDPPFAHADVIQIEAESQYNQFDPRQRDSAGNAQSYNIDRGVRFVDLNRDGLAELVKASHWVRTFPNGFGSPAVFEPRPGVALLNRGARRGDPRHAAWCASRATAGVPTCEEALAYELPRPVSLPVEVRYGPGLASKWLEHRAELMVFDDVNGDGWVDYITSVGLPTSAVFVFIQQPGDPDSVWLDRTADYPDLPGLVTARDGPNSIASGTAWDQGYGASGYAFTDANGDGVVDFIASERQVVTQLGSWVSTPESARSDLLTRYSNGRGQVVEVGYASAIQQRSPAREAQAMTQAFAALTDADPGNDALAEPIDAAGFGLELRTFAAPSAVVSERTVRAADRSASTTHYHYAHRRRCLAHRSDHGFRFVETWRGDGSRTETFYYQDHGRAGALAERTRFDATDHPVHFEAEEWVLPDPATVVGGFSSGTGPFSSSAIGRLARSTAWNEYGASVGDSPGSVSTTTYRYDDQHGYGFIREIEVDEPGRGRVTVLSPEPVDDTYFLTRRRSSVQVFAKQPGDHRLLASSTYAYFDRSGRFDPRHVGLRADFIDSRDTPGDPVWRWTYFQVSEQGNRIEERVQYEAGRHAEGRVTRWCYDGDPGCPLGQGSHSLVVGTRDALGKWRYEDAHPVFAAPERQRSHYRDEPTLRFEFDALGRRVAEWVESRGSAAEALRTAWIHVDRPASGLLFEAGVQPYRVTQRFAAAGAAPVSESIEVAGGMGAPALEVELLFDAAGVGRAIASERYMEPDARRETVSEPFSCGIASSSGGLDRGAILAACALVPDAEKSHVVRTQDALGRLLRVDTPLGFELWERRAESLLLAGEATSRSLDVVLHKNANGALQERVLAAGAPVRIRDCSDEAMDPALSSLSGVVCLDPEESRLVYEPTGALRSRIDPTVVAGAWLGGTSGLSESQHLTYVRDTLGRIIEVQDPDAGRSRQTYDLFGNVVASVDARGIEVRNTFDALDRPTRIETDGEAPTRIFYAGNVLQRKRIVDGTLGNLSKLLFYDEFGRPERVVRIVDGYRMRTDYQTDLLGRPLEIRFPTVLGGHVDRVLYEYDGAFLGRVCDPGHDAGNCDGTTATALLEGVDYDGLGRVVSMQLPGGERSLAYDGHSQRRRWDRFDAEGGEDVAFDYVPADASDDAAAAYDGLGNVERVDARIGSGSGALSLGHDFTYDGRNRIASWRFQDASSPAPFEYDARGNLVSHAGNLQGFEPLPASPDPAVRAHAIRSRREPDGRAWAYEYDAAGHRVREVASTGLARFFRFDGRGRLVCAGSVANGCDALSVLYRGDGERARERGSRTFYYAGPSFRMTRTPGRVDEYWIEIHALGQRIAYKHVEGGALRTTELWPGWEAPSWLRPVAQRCAGLIALSCLLLFCVVLSRAPRPIRSVASLLASALVTVAPIQVWAGGGAVDPTVAGTAAFRWILMDQLGTASVEIDAAGHGLRFESFSPFGRIAAQGGSSGTQGRRMFGGHDRQLDLGLVYMNARWMSPGTGSFLSVDPVVRNPHVGASLNGYAYVENNPISSIDPTGRTEADKVEVPVIDPTTGETTRTVFVEPEMAGVLHLESTDGGGASATATPVAELAAGLAGAGVGLGGIGSGLQPGSPADPGGSVNRGTGAEGVPGGESMPPPAAPQPFVRTKQGTKRGLHLTLAPKGVGPAVAIDLTQDAATGESEVTVKAGIGAGVSVSATPSVRAGFGAEVGEPGATMISAEATLPVGGTGLVVQFEADFNAPTGAFGARFGVSVGPGAGASAMVGLASTFD